MTYTTDPVTISKTLSESSYCSYVKLLTQNEISVSVGETFDIMVQSLDQYSMPIYLSTFTLQLQNTIASYDSIGPIPANLVSLQTANSTFTNGIYTFTGNKVYQIIICC